MRLTAYVLAGDPAWVESSVAAYYHAVERIVVSYDAGKKGWTGAAIPVDECIDRLRAIDADRKMVLAPGDYARGSFTPAENDTFQRQCAMEAAAPGADWILTLDSDEVLPRADRLVARLAREVRPGFAGVRWPFRVFFHALGGGELLEVCDRWGRCAVESAVVAVRPGAKLKYIRNPEGEIWRYGLRRSFLARLRGGVQGTIGGSEAVLHLSWVRSESAILRKLGSWGHAEDFDTRRYFEETWKAAPARWRSLRDFHPIWPEQWPRLRPARVPAAVLRGSPRELVELGVVAPVELPA